MDQLLGLRHRQRLQQNRVDHSEDGGIRADAEREGQNGRGREAAVLPEEAEAEAEVLQHLVLYARP